MKKKEGIQVSFSGGRSSAMMAYIMKENIGLDSMIFTFANTGKEKEETLVFVQKCSEEFEIPIYWIEYDPIDGFIIVDFDTASRSGEPFDKLIKKKNYLPNPVARFCTADLKVRPMKKFLMSLGFSYWDAALGIRFDEKRRAAKLRASQGKDRWEYIMPLFDMKLTEKDVLQFWKSQSFDLDLMQHEGNCDLCFLKSRNAKRAIMKNDPKSADWWLKKENQIGSTFRSDISYKQLLTQSQMPTLFDVLEEGPLDQCLCGVI